MDDPINELKENLIIQNVSVHRIFRYSQLKVLT